MTVLCSAVQVVHPEVRTSPPVASKPCNILQQRHMLRDVWTGVYNLQTVRQSPGSSSCCCNQRHPKTTSSGSSRRVQGLETRQFKGGALLRGSSTDGHRVPVLEQSCCSWGGGTGAMGRTNWKRGGEAVKERAQTLRQKPPSFKTRALLKRGSHRQLCVMRSGAPVVPFVWGRTGPTGRAWAFRRTCSGS